MCVVLIPLVRTVPGRQVPEVDMTNYVTVAERMTAAFDRWPDMRVQESLPQVREIDGQTVVEVTVMIYRTPDDPLPGIGSAWEPFPGTTPFTRGSEMMNASTSAIGRVLAAMGVGAQRSLASADEVRARQPDPLDPDAGPPAEVKAVKAVRDAFPGAEVSEPKRSRKEPTEKMLNYLKALAAKADVAVTQAELTDFDACKAAIERLKGG